MILKFIAKNEPRFDGEIACFRDEENVRMEMKIEREFERTNGAERSIRGKIVYFWRKRPMCFVFCLGSLSRCLEL